MCVCAQGIFISRVSEDGPAARAGVKVGDKLLEVGVTPSSCFIFRLQTRTPRVTDCLWPSGSLRLSLSLSLPLSLPQVNGVDLHGAEHHTAVEALRSSGSSVSMSVVRERMVEPENAITTTPLRPEDDYFPRERRSSGLPFLMDASPPAPRHRLSTCLVRNDKGLGFSIAGGKGSTAFRTGDAVRDKHTHGWRSQCGPSVQTHVPSVSVKLKYN